jgi:ThiF family
MTRVNEINTILNAISDLTVTRRFVEDEIDIKGSISIFVEGLYHPLDFNVSILPEYPFRTHETESIKFSNENLLEYKHIMGNGSICIHTAHSPVLSEKLFYDIGSVKAWIKKYYIDKDNDDHYEHLIVSNQLFNGSQFSFFFTEVDYTFTKHQFGFVDYSTISNGVFYKDKINNNILQRFFDSNKKLIVDLKWNYLLKSLVPQFGLFIFLQNAPSINQRWVFNKWEDFKSLLPHSFLQFLHEVQQNSLKEKGKFLPLFMGYNISKSEIHWQAIMLEIGSFPIYGERVDKNWNTTLRNDITIDWAMTRNCSYKYFYGRGKLSDKLTTGKILIIGIGAIGSMIAKTLVKSGCTRLDFIDYDIKEPENICRSEYSFISGITNKTNDLLNEMCLISPFFESTTGGYAYSEMFNFYLKSGLSKIMIKSELETKLNEYDFIFDCTADNDMLYLLSQLNISTNLLNISISNHAKHLVCANENNRYEFVSTQFNGNVLKFDIDDLHNPTGCWNPTFKASYNDINLLVQCAIKHINLKYKENKDLRNFVIETNSDDCLTINLKEF